MATIPTVPTFASNDSSLTNLQDLAAAVKFISDADVRPYWHFYRAATQSYTATAWTVLTFNAKAFDSDGVYSSPGALIVTEGYYTLTACYSVECTATSEGLVGAFKLTGGANNPKLATGATYYHGFRGSLTSSVTPTDNSVNLSDVTPFALYAGDLVEVVTWVNGALTGDYNQNTSYTQGRFVTNFTGRWARKGP